MDHKAHFLQAEGSLQTRNSHITELFSDRICRFSSVCNYSVHQWLLKLTSESIPLKEILNSLVDELYHAICINLLHSKSKWHQKNLMALVEGVTRLTLWKQCGYTANFILMQFAKNCNDATSTVFSLLRVYHANL